MKKVSRYGCKIPDGWTECLGCSAIVARGFSNSYTFGYCTSCIGRIPNYLPQEQWVKWLNEKRKEILPSM